MKLTSWYSGDQKPVHIGVYERDYLRSTGYGPTYCWFDGTEFRVSHPDPARCTPADIFSPHQNLTWRGVTE